MQKYKAPWLPYTHWELSSGRYALDSMYSRSDASSRSADALHPGAAARNGSLGVSARATQPVHGTLGRR